MTRPTQLPRPRPALFPIELFALAIILIVPLLQAFRGLDLTDTGFVLTNQRFFFSAPQNVSYWFHLWLTNLLGGLVDLAFGRFGILPHRFAAAAIYWLCCLMVFVAFRTLLKRWVILLSLAATVSFHFAAKINIVHYNNVSALLLIVGTVLLVRGAMTGKALDYFFAGFVLAANSFARIPNAPGIFLILLVPIVGALLPKDMVRPRLTLRVAVAYGFGIAVAVAVALGTMKALGQLDIYFESLHGLAASTSGVESNYGLFYVIMRPIRDTVLAFAGGGILFALLALISRLLRSVKSVLIKAIAFAILSLVFFWAGRLLYQYSHERIMFRIVAGICYLPATLIVFDRSSRFDFRSRLTAALGAATLVVLNVGSDTGISVASYAFLFVFPTLQVALNGYTEQGVPERRFWIANFGILVYLFVGAMSAYSIPFAVYRDAAIPERTSKIQQFSGIFTTNARATALEEVIPEISRRAPPGTKILIHDSACLLHFATRTLPYLDNPWPAQYGEKELDLLLHKKETSGLLPIVVLAKQNPRSTLWPASGLDPVRTAPVLGFIARNGYRLVWESSAFRIFAVEKR
jgi:hypothetical protein